MAGGIVAMGVVAQQQQERARQEELTQRQAVKISNEDPDVNTTTTVPTPVYVSCPKQELQDTSGNIFMLCLILLIVALGSFALGCFLENLMSKLRGTETFKR
jgi:membrane-associated HD superfamily phosphohydrolase